MMEVGGVEKGEGRGVTTHGVEEVGAAVEAVLMTREEVGVTS